MELARKERAGRVTEPETGWPGETAGLVAANKPQAGDGRGESRSACTQSGTGEAKKIIRPPICYDSDKEADYDNFSWSHFSQ